MTSIRELNHLLNCVKFLKNLEACCRNALLVGCMTKASMDACYQTKFSVFYGAENDVRQEN